MVRDSVRPNPYRQRRRTTTSTEEGEEMTPPPPTSETMTAVDAFTSATRPPVVVTRHEQSSNALSHNLLRLKPDNRLLHRRFGTPVVTASEATPVRVFKRGRRHVHGQHVVNHASVSVHPQVWVDGYSYTSPSLVQF